MSVPAIKASEKVNWNTIKLLRSHSAPLSVPLAKNWFFNATTGLKADNTNAGYKPANKLTINTVPIIRNGWFPVPAE